VPFEEGEDAGKKCNENIISLAFFGD